MEKAPFKAASESLGKRRKSPQGSTLRTKTLSVPSSFFDDVGWNCWCGMDDALTTHQDVLV